MVEVSSFPVTTQYLVEAVSYGITNITHLLPNSSSSSQCIQHLLRQKLLQIHRILDHQLTLTKWPNVWIWRSPLLTDSALYYCALRPTVTGKPRHTVQLYRIRE